MSMKMTDRGDARAHLCGNLGRTDFQANHFAIRSSLPAPLSSLRVCAPAGEFSSRKNTMDSRSRTTNQASDVTRKRGVEAAGKMISVVARAWSSGRLLRRRSRDGAQRKAGREYGNCSISRRRYRAGRPWPGEDFATIITIKWGSRTIWTGFADRPARRRRAFGSGTR